MNNTIAETRCDLVAEELKLSMGLDVKVVKDGFYCHLELDTIFGLFKYHPTEPTYMGDVYRFIYHYASKLHTWGLASKLKEYDKIKLT